MTDSRWEAWLYERHSRAELRAWATRLRWFRFCRAVGGHGDAGDDLRLALRAETEPELLAVLAALGITATTLPADAPQPVPGVAYPAGEYRAFGFRIDRFPHLRQPGHVRIGGQPAHAWAGRGRLELSLSDPDEPYEVTGRTVTSAVAIEAELDTAALTVVDPPLDSRHCLCPKYYPELWDTG
jgi:hypothetical protein